jgi:dUTP pyrophosphatase
MVDMQLILTIIVGGNFRRKKMSEENINESGGANTDGTDASWRGGIRNPNLVYPGQGWTSPPNQGIYFTSIPGCASQVIPVRFEKMVKEYPNIDIKLPYKSMELRAYYDVESIEDVELTPEEVAMVHTGLKLQSPVGWFIDIRPRSGLAKEGVTINNSPGTMDCNYGGELIVELIWHTTEHIESPIGINYSKYSIKKGDRIAQIGIHPMHYINFIEDKIEGTGGFGSSGR